MQQEAGWRKLWQAEAVLGHFHVRPHPPSPGHPLGGEECLSPRGAARVYGRHSAGGPGWQQGMLCIPGGHGQ